MPHPDPPRSPLVLAIRLRWPTARRSSRRWRTDVAVPGGLSACAGPRRHPACVPSPHTSLSSCLGRALEPLSNRRMDFEEFCAAAISPYQLEALEGWERMAGDRRSSGNSHQEGRWQQLFLRFQGLGFRYSPFIEARRKESECRDYAAKGEKSRKPANRAYTPVMLQLRKRDLEGLTRRRRTREIRAAEGGTGYRETRAKTN
ncbi:CDPK-related kinase 4 [Platanthera guangdongensis]|uniref:CDPK-related kinase 4 n=1 Tax=Platanthera guangdongensis TaxID=2320717 RepID=A0ABR2N3T4_9ASPA